MLKFLRKYQLLLLVVGGSLLMVSFLIGPVIQQIASQFFTPIAAEIGPDREQVPVIDMQLASREADIVLRFDPTNPLGIDRDEEGRHWYLLTREAERLGLAGYQSDAEAWLRQAAVRFLRSQSERAVLQEIAPQFGGIEFLARRPQLLQQIVANPGFQAQVRQRMSGRIEETVQQYEEARVAFAENSRGLTVEQLDTVFAKAAAVQRMRDLYRGAPALSDRRMKSRAQELYSEAVADVLTIPASIVLGQVEEPTDDELRAFFEEYRDDARGDLEANRYGLGYRLPNRIQIEWMTIDPDAIEGAIEVDRIEVRRRWREDNPEADPSEFDDDRPALEARMRGELATEIARDADEIVRAAVRRALSSASEAGNYFDLPGGFDPGTLALEPIAREVVREIEERYGVAIPPPAVDAIEDRFVTAADLRNRQPFGTAEYRIGSRRIPAAEIADRLRQFRPEEPTLGAQVGVPIFQPPARATVGNEIYFFRPTAARPAGPAVGLAEVESQVRRDYRFVRAFERLEARTSEILETARNQGIAAVHDLFEVARQDPPEGQTKEQQLQALGLNVRRDQTFGAVGPGEGQQAAFREAVVEAARSINPTRFDQPQESIVVMPIPEARAVAVARVHALRPVTLERFQRAEEAFGSTIPAFELAGISEKIGDVDPFSLSSLARRLRFRPLDNDEQGLLDNPDRRAPDANEEN